MIQTIAFSPDGRILASGGRDEAIILWNMATGQELRTFDWRSPREIGGDWIYSLAFSPNGKRLAVGRTDPIVKVRDVVTGRELMALKGHSDIVRYLTYSPDGKTLATASFDKTVRLWDAQTGKELMALKGHAAPVYCVAFSPDGKRLATGSDGTVKLWDIMTGQGLITLQGQTVTSVAFSPDGKTLATGGTDSIAKLWHAAKEQVVLATPPTRYQEVVKVEERQSVTILPPQLPKGWLRSGGNPGDYDMDVDHLISYNGKASGRISSKGTARGSGVMMQMIKADDFRGKRVRLSGYLKTSFLGKYTTFFLRTDGPGYYLNFDNMQDRRIFGAKNWQKYELVIDVPEESLAIAFGIVLDGEGQVWIDDLQLEIVGQDVPSTEIVGHMERNRDAFLRRDPDERKRLEEQARARARSWRAKPVNLDFEDRNP